MALTTAVGSWPGDDDRDYVEVCRLVTGELGHPPGLPALPEMPGRGAPAGMIGRTLALVAEAGLGVDLQPAGWRLTDAAGVDSRRAVAQLTRDLDVWEEHTQDYAGAMKVQVAGPWTLAAAVERPRGDKVLADHGARRELAEALTEGLGTHLAGLRRRVPGVDRWIVQLDEPLLPAVLAAQVPTASGFGKHRAIDRPEASAALEAITSAVAAGSDAESWLHSCARGTPIELALGAGIEGLLVDAATLTAADHDALAGALDSGRSVALGVLPALGPDPRPSPEAVTERVLRWLDLVGLDPQELADRLLVTTGCGLAGATPDWARATLDLGLRAARNLTS